MVYVFLEDNTMLKSIFSSSKNETGINDLKDQLTKAQQKLTTYQRNISAIKKLTEELDQTHVALQESESLFRTLSELIPAGILIISDYKVKFINSGLSKITGYAKTDFDELSDNVINLFLAEDRPKVIELLENRYVKFNKTWDCDVRIICKDSSVKWINMHTQNIVYENKPSLLITGFDISSQKKVEETLRLKNKQFSYLFNNIPVSVMLEDFSIVQKWLKSLPVTDSVELEEYLTLHEEELDYAIGLFKIQNMNPYTINLLTNNCATLEEFRDHKFKEFLLLNKEHIKLQLCAIYDNDREYSGKFNFKRLDGSYQTFLIKWFIPPDNGVKGINNVLVSVVDVHDVC